MIAVPVFIIFTEKKIHILTIKAGSISEKCHLWKFWVLNNLTCSTSFLNLSLFQTHKHTLSHINKLTCQNTNMWHKFICLSYTRLVTTADCKLWYCHGQRLRKKLSAQIFVGICQLRTKPNYWFDQKTKQSHFSSQEQLLLLLP